LDYHDLRESSHFGLNKTKASPPIVHTFLQVLVLDIIFSIHVYTALHHFPPIIGSVGDYRSTPIPVET
jgi:hypothetical protein